MALDMGELLMRLADAGALCLADHGNLHIDMEEHHWTPTLRHAMPGVKSSILHLLTLTDTRQASAETLLGWYDWYEERAAIREYCGGQPRDEAERDAWNDVRQHFNLESHPHA